MPFWWNRRKRFWRRNYRRKPRYKKYKPRRYRRAYRTKYRRANRRGRRRRRRRRKVRRKKQTIPVRQWQPDSIVTCKIKGLSTLVLGAEGKQLVCYTNVKNANTPPKAPAGGGFGCEQFSLESLYTDFIFRKNIWTKSNTLKDLCRYLGVKMVFYRAPETDFIVSYSRQPPFEISKEIYTSCHPLNMILDKHKIIIPSRFTNPRGKLKVKKFIKPPKQMLSKWFFQEHFANYPLVMIKATACNLNYSNLGCCNTNQMVTFFYMNINWYSLADWSARKSGTAIYTPYANFPSYIYTWNKKQWDTQTTALDSQKFTKPTNYFASVNIKTGFFSPQILQAVQITTGTGKETITRNNPLNICRYNPNLDSGKKNKIWLVSTLTTTWDPPHSDKILIYEGYPLYMMLWGFLSYVQAIKKSPDFFTGYVLAMQSPALLPYSQPGAQTAIIVPLDYKMPQGKAPYDEELTDSMKTLWFPTIYNQLEILNAIVESGPLVPKYSQTKNSTWELDMFYTFIFKWGGPEITEQQIADPHLQGTYEVPDTLQKAIQIHDPAKQKIGSLLHPWDIRRGYFTKTALKRMHDNLSTESSFIPDGEEIPTKKKKQQTGPELSHPYQEEEEVQSSLLSLFEENIYPETQTQTPEILQLIKQQQQQQQELKYNILRIISDIKAKQNLLRLQTGAMF
nr:MAG: ORF1 [Torque teno midi virus]